MLFANLLQHEIELICLPMNKYFEKNNSFNQNNIYQPSIFNEWMNAWTDREVILVKHKQKKNEVGNTNTIEVWGKVGKVL